MKSIQNEFSAGARPDERHDGMSRSTGASVLLPRKTKPSLRPDIIEDFYELRDREEVYGIIEGNQFLVPLLMEAHTEIQKHFPEAQRLFLEPFSYDDDFATPALSLYIQVSLTGEAARKRLRGFDEEWWLANVPRADRLLCIDVERV